MSVRRGFNHGLPDAGLAKPLKSDLVDRTTRTGYTVLTLDLPAVVPFRRFGNQLTRNIIGSVGHQFKLSTLASLSI